MGGRPQASENRPVNRHSSGLAGQLFGSLPRLTRRGRLDPASGVEVGFFQAAVRSLSSNVPLDPFAGVVDGFFCALLGETAD